MIVRGILAFIISAITVPCVIWVSNIFKKYDQIDGRKSHITNISRLGGIGIFISFFCVFCFLVSAEKVLPFNKMIYIGAMLVAFLTGLVDDIWHLRARYKLALQCIAGALVAFSGLRIQDSILYNWLPLDPVFLSWFFTIIWVVAFMNAINLIDGLDGLAAGIVIIASIFLYILAASFHSNLVMQLCVILCGSTLGFYIYNFPSAKIFMGDSGAYLLGFIYSTLPLMGVSKSSAATILIIPIVLLLFPLWDIGKVIYTRIKMGKHIFTPDRNHIHHRLLKIGFSKKRIVFVIYLYTIILGLCSVLLLHIDAPYSFLLFATVFLLVALSFFVIDTVESILETQKNKAEVLDNDTKNSKNNDFIPSQKKQNTEQAEELKR